MAENVSPSRFSRVSRDLDLETALATRGVVLGAGDGVAVVAGLDTVAYEELVRFDSGALGLAFDLRVHQTGVLVLSHPERVCAGDGAVGLGCLPDLPVGPGTLGRVFDPLGKALDDAGDLPLKPRLPLFRAAPELLDRKSVDQPLATGVLVLDATVPIGRGQRELIIGDRNVGKTALAEDIVVAQRSGDVACVYVAIGQPLSRVLALRDRLMRVGALDNTAIVAADASAPPGMRYLAPYAGASVAEWFRDQGRHALVVYDDLTKHADAYRELSLLLDRPPGREAFPGDVFYVQAELLERATALGTTLGGGSVTALPIVETTENDIAAYIPTNVISITDGQIYLDTARFVRNQRPAVDIGRSVSRIGGAAQPEAMRIAARNLRILYARFEELESLARVGLELETSVERDIARGQLLRALLRQERMSPRSVAEQVLTILAATGGWMDGLDPAHVADFVDALIARARADEPVAMNSLDRGQQPEGTWQSRIQALCETMRATTAHEETP